MTANDTATAAAAVAAAQACPWESDLEGLRARIEGYLEMGGAGYDSESVEYEGLADLWEAMGLLPRRGGAASDEDSDDDDGKKGQQQRAARSKGKAGGEQQSKHQQPQQQGQQQGQPVWYSAAFDYWEAEGNCPATVDGVLGGFGHVSPKDIAGSRAFVARLRAALPTLKLGRVVGKSGMRGRGMGDGKR